MRLFFFFLFEKNSRFGPGCRSFCSRTLQVRQHPIISRATMRHPQTPQATVPVTYKAAQTAGNLNVVIVGWNDSSTQVSSVTDSKGNTYQLAMAPMVLTGSPALSQAIYYAKIQFGCHGRHECSDGEVQCGSELSGHSDPGI